MLAVRKSDPIDIPGKRKVERFPADPFENYKKAFRDEFKRVEEPRYIKDSKKEGYVLWKGTVTLKKHPIDCEVCFYKQCRICSSMTPTGDQACACGVNITPGRHYNCRECAFYWKSTI